MLKQARRLIWVFARYGRYTHAARVPAPTPPADAEVPEGAVLTLCGIWVRQNPWPMPAPERCTACEREVPK